VWRSWLARTAGGREVAGSSPVTPTINIHFDFVCEFIGVIVDNLNLRPLNTYSAAYGLSRKFKSCHPDHKELVYIYLKQ
jgi:hypothetical protein